MYASLFRDFLFFVLFYYIALNLNFLPAFAGVGAVIKQEDQMPKPRSKCTLVCSSSEVDYDLSAVLLKRFCNFCTARLQEFQLTTVAAADRHADIHMLPHVHRYAYLVDCKVSLAHMCLLAS